MNALFIGSLKKKYNNTTLRRTYELYFYETRATYPSVDILDFFWPLTTRQNDITFHNFQSMYTRCQEHYPQDKSLCTFNASRQRCVMVTYEDRIDYFFYHDGLDPTYPFHHTFIDVIVKDLTSFFTLLQAHETT